MSYVAYVDGIFDIPHQGHFNALANAYQKAIEELAADQEKSLDENKGEVKLLVGVCDEGVTAYKREPIMTAKERQQALTALIADQFKAVVITEEVPIAINEEFIRKHNVKLVVHGDDFDPNKLEEYYGAAIKLAKFVTVPYTKGVSTTEVIRTAKSEGRFIIDTDHLEGVVDQKTLMNRIKQRSWEELKIEDPSLFARLKRADHAAFLKNYEWTQEVMKNPKLHKVVWLSWYSFQSACIGGTYLSVDITARLFASVRDGRNQLGNAQYLGTRVIEWVRDCAGAVLSTPTALLSPDHAVSFHVKSDDYLARALTLEEAADLYAIGYRLINFFDRHGIDYRMTSGTFLGAVRHKGVIPWDDDIDLLLHPSSEVKMRALITDGTFEKETGLKMFWQEFTGGWQAFFPDGRKGSDYLQETRVPFIDLFTTGFDNNNNHIVYRSKEMCRLASQEYYTSEEWDRFKDYEFGPITLRGPVNHYPYFNRAFGPDAMFYAYQTVHHTDFEVKRLPQRVVIRENESIKYSKEQFDSRVEVFKKLCEKKETMVLPRLEPVEGYNESGTMGLSEDEADEVLQEGAMRLLRPETDETLKEDGAMRLLIAES